MSTPSSDGAFGDQSSTGGKAESEDALEPKYVPVATLQLDLKNPRHPEAELDSLDEALQQLVHDADVNELVQAIGNSGWLNYEPLVVLRGGNVVLEGNRRLAALQILSSVELQARFGISPPDPLHPRARPLEVQAVLVDDRDQARDFIGFKHVNGPHKWDSLAKAKFAWEWSRGPNGLTLAQIAKRLGDGHNTVARLVNAYVVLQQGIELGFDISQRTKATFSFSHLYTALPRPNVRDHLGLTDAPNELLSDSPVPPDKRDTLVQFLTLLYGQGDRKTVIQSQNPNLNELIDVLGNPTATAMLISDNDLRVAYAQVEDRGRRFAERVFALNKAARAAAEAAGDYSYDPDLDDMMNSVMKTVRGIVSAMTVEKDSMTSQPGSH